jgi:subfamily B ATP-binding cassette protein MsbA
VTDFLRLLEHAKPYRGRLALAFVAMAAYGASQAAFLQIVSVMVDDVLQRGERLSWVIGAILIISIVRGISGYASVFVMTDVGQRVVRDLRERFFSHVLRQSATFFSRRSSGQLLSRLTNDISQIQRAVSETTGDLIRESLTLVGIIGWMFWKQWELAMVCTVTAPLVVYPLSQLGRRVRGQSRRSQEEIEHLTHIATEAFSGHRIVKAFGAEDREDARFRAASSKLYRTYMKVTSLVASLPPIMEFVGGVAIIGVLWYGQNRIGRGLLTVGDFMAFLSAAVFMYQPLKRLSGANASIQQALAASTRIFEMLDRDTEVKDRAGAPAIKPLAVGVEYRDIGFAYDDEPDRFIVRHASFTVRKGQVVALVGLSGAGKTTLVNLLPRFYDTKEGAVLIDGVDIRDVTLRSLREQIALVTQETVLFDDTIAENIAYGRPNAPKDVVEAAARAAHAHEFIMAMPAGYETRIGERGQRLSGGQRQRLAIARALLRNSPLLILDEATSSLDAESESLVQDALATLMQNRTTFVIAHRLSTVRRADLIVALEKGRVAEIGTHDQLVNKPGGVYARLYALQMFDEREPAEPGDQGKEQT